MDIDDHRRHRMGYTAGAPRPGADRWRVVLAPFGAHKDAACRPRTEPPTPSVAACPAPGRRVLPSRARVPRALFLPVLFLPVLFLPALGHRTL